MVDGMVMKVMTSCSLRPASRARKPPMAWMPSCELPAMRIVASGTEETRGLWPDDETTVDSLMRGGGKWGCAGGGGGGGGGGGPRPRRLGPGADPAPRRDGSKAGEVGVNRSVSSKR